MISMLKCSGVKCTNVSLTNFEMQQEIKCWEKTPTNALEVYTRQLGAISRMYR